MTHGRIHQPKKTKKNRVNALSQPLLLKKQRTTNLDSPQRGYVGRLNGSSCNKKKPSKCAVTATFTQKTKNYKWLDSPQRGYVGSLNGFRCNKKNNMNFSLEKSHHPCDAHPSSPRPLERTYRHSHSTIEYVLIRHVLAGTWSYHDISRYVQNDNSYPFHNLLSKVWPTEWLGITLRSD